MKKNPTSKHFNINDISREHFSVRLTVIFVSLIILVSVSFTTIFVQQQSQILVDNLHERGTLLAKLLSYNSRVGTFSGSESMLEGPVSSVMEQKGVLSSSVFTLEGEALIVRGNAPKNAPHEDVLNSIKKEDKTVLVEKENEIEFWNPIRSAPIRLSDDFLQPSFNEKGNGGRIIGVVRVNIDKTPLTESIDDLILNGFLIAVVFLLGTITITLVIVKQVTTPLNRLTEAAIKFGKDEDEEEAEPLEVESNDEIGKLTTAFNEMTLSLKTRQKEKESLEEQLLYRQKMDAIGVLAGGIAHDFNNILSSVLFKLALAKKDMISGKDITRRFAELEMVFNRAKGLTQQLLTFSKGGSPIRQATSVAEVIKETVGFTLCGSNVKCNINVPDDLNPINADENQISQVINNLIINADQAMPDGGDIWLTGKNLFVPQKNLLLLPKGNYVQLQVKDNGVGILEEDRKKIFDPYYTTKQRGVGLGLALTYSIIKKHDGHIEVSSELNEGTTFTIYLPSTLVDTEEKEGDWDLPTYGKGRILIMDDETGFRTDAIEFLSTIGFSVSEANDGKEALAMYKEAKEERNPFDIVIMDLTIPGGMGGEEAIEKLLQYDPTAKAIVSSGYANSPIMSNYKKHGFRGVVIKPFKIHDFTNLINRVIGKEK